MKKIYVLLSICFLTVSSFAQWTTLTSGVTNTLRASYFFDGSHGYVVGEGVAPLESPILKTTDGGITWTNIASGTSQALRDIYFVNNSDTGIIVGFAGTILKTTNGGSTWTAMSSGTTQNLRSISFPSHNIGYIAGAKGLCLKTTDAGLTWSTLTTGIDSDLITVRFADNNNGYAVSCGSNLSNFNKGLIIKTTDGGATWTQVYYNENDGLLGLAVPDVNTIFAGGHDDIIVKSSNGGSSWEVVDTGVVNHQIRAAFFVSPAKGWLTCDVGDIFYTEDGGATWTNQTISLNGVYGLYFPSQDTGYGVGAAGGMVKYTAACVPFTSIGSIEGSTTACAGDTVNYTILTVIGADSYTWTVPGDASVLSGQGQTQVTVVLGSASGNITVLAESSCDSISTGLELLVNALPPVPIITFSNDLLSSDALTGNQWYFNGAAITGAVNQTYTPTQDGNYTVTVTNGNGCSSTSSPLNVIGTGISELSQQAIVTAYPNPFQAFTTLSFSTNMKMSNGKVVISNVEGMVVKIIDDVTGLSVTISRGMLSSGLYYYRLLDGKNNVIAIGKLVAE